MKFRGEYNKVMKDYQYYLFDWDGNLAQTLHIWLEVFRDVFAAHGIHKSDREIAETFGQFKKYVEKWGLQDGEAIHDEARNAARERLPHAELYPDAIEVLNTLRQRGKRLALITTSTHDNVSHLLDKYELRQYFDVIVAADDVTHFKPHPEPLEKALTLLGGTREQAVMIGDSDKDLGAAQNFGIDSILFYPHEHEVFYDLEDLKMHNPTFIIHDFKDILTS